MTSERSLSSEGLLLSRRAVSSFAVTSTVAIVAVFGTMEGQGYWWRFLHTASAILAAGGLFFLCLALVAFILFRQNARTGPQQDSQARLTGPIIVEWASRMGVFLRNTGCVLLCLSAVSVLVLFFVNERGAAGFGALGMAMTMFVNVTGPMSLPLAVLFLVTSFALNRSRA